MSAKEARRPIFMKALAYELGEHERAVSELPDAPEEVRATLVEAGLDAYRVSSRSPLQLARRPIDETLAALSPAERAGIGRAIFATNSFHDATLTAQSGASHLLVELGLPEITPVGVFLSFCANLHSALELAQALLRHDGDGSILVLCADVLGPSESRLVPPNISVFSDAAASFVLSFDEGPYEVLGTRLRVDAAVGLLDRTREFIQYMEGVSRGVKGLADEILAAAGLDLSAVRWVFPNNYNRWSCRSMAELVGFAEDRLYLENLGRVAHAFAADNVINLCDFEHAGQARTGDTLALFGTGGFQWGCTLIRVT